MSQSCSRKDLVSGRSFWLLWGLPGLAVLLGIFTVPLVRTMLWTPAFLVMGTACLLNARRCGRLHCYFTGPLALMAALATVLVGTGLLPLPWSWIGFGALGGTILAYLPEWVRGKYLARPSP